MKGYTLKNEYQSLNGKVTKISNINFAKFSDLMDFKWELVKESHKSSSIKFIDSGYEKISVLVYRNPLNSRQGARIYGDYADYKYTYYNDDTLISKLQEKQPFIKLTEFPYGVITIGNKIIGQQIPFYDGYIEIGEMINKKISIEQIINYGFKLIDIFSELLAYDIYYSDIHLGNILVNPLNDDIKLIDFEQPFVTTYSLDSEKSCDKIVANRLSNLINDLGCNMGVSICGLVNSLNDLKDKLLEVNNRLVKK